MSARAYVTVWCDGPECSQFVETGEHRATDARRQVRLYNRWTRRKGHDLCPECAARSGRPS